MMMNDKLLLIVVVVALCSMFLVTYLDTTTEAAAEQTTTANQNVTTNNVTKINQVIGEGLNECSELDTDSCLGVMYTLDNICQVAYFPECFGDIWNGFMKHLEQRIQEGDYPDARYADDPYLTLNNHHYGNSDWIK